MTSPNVPDDDVGLRVRGRAGVAVRGTGTAFPSGPYAVRRDNVDILQRLADRPRSHEAIAFTAAALQAEYDVRDRAWVHDVGGPQLPGEQTTLDLATKAASAAIADASARTGEVVIDAVLVVTSTPHRLTSTVAGPLGHQLGLRAACFDIRGGCAASMFALAQATMLLDGGARGVIVVGADTFSRVLPTTDPRLALVMGDGAGAVVLTRGSGALLGACVCTDGDLGHLLQTRGPLPPTAEAVADGGYRLEGAWDAFAAAVKPRYARAIEGALAVAERRASDVDVYVPHQSNAGLIRATAATHGWQRAVCRVERHGNIGAGSALVALSEGLRDGDVVEGDTVLLAGVGGGMTWGGVLLSLNYS